MKVGLPQLILTWGMVYLVGETAIYSWKSLQYIHKVQCQWATGHELLDIEEETN
jgi:hypothetical protein